MTASGNVAEQRRVLWETDRQFVLDAESSGEGVMESLYWVFTLKCNDICDHCYNNSGPRGETVDTDELLRVVPNLPASPGRLILSGGEPLVEMGKLEVLVRALKQRYDSKVQIGVQSNGDLLNERRLERLLEVGIDRIDIASLDRFHRQQGKHVERLVELFGRFGMEDANQQTDRSPTGCKFYALWGANEEIWLGGNWARGRALQSGAALLDPDHNFCALWSGALGFLDDGSAKQEVHVQLYRLYPCCPTTLFSLGDVREESVDAILARHRELETFQILNRGDPYSLGTEAALSPEYIRERIVALGDVCLWCDEYFDKHYDGPRGERRRPAVDHGKTAIQAADSDCQATTLQ